jgi:hypothetical protein
LRHQLIVLRRQTPRPKLAPADRALLAAISRALPRSRWSCFFVRPETLLRWHRQLVAGAWTYPAPPDRKTTAGRGGATSDHPPCHGEPAVGLPAAQGRTPAPRCPGLGHHDPHDAASAWAGSRAHGGWPPPGGRSCANRPPGSSPVTSVPSTGVAAAVVCVVLHRTGHPAGALGRRDRPPEWCLDWLLIVGRGHLEQVLRVYVEHYNGHRPQRALQLESPDAPTGPVVISDNQRRVLRRDRLSGLLHEYHRQAA